MADKDLKDNSREELDELAENEGVENPSSLQNKDEVIAEIEEVRSQRSFSVVVTPTDIYSVKAESSEDAVKKAKKLHKSKQKESEEE